MRRVHVLFLLLVAALALAAAGCGGGSDEKSTEDAGAVCEGEALSGDTGLPANFPSWDEVTYTFKEQEGPTLVVKGWFDGPLDAAYREFKDRFEEANYTILFDELEDKDSEISYKDPEGATSGQLALRDECDNGHIFVRITNRAA
jgi:ABC-type glycerol-3-phosphate transport system substrate-binding protein